MTELHWMRLALRLARRGYGYTSPNPMVGAVLVRNNREIGRGWHHQAGSPHAEVEALRDAHKRGTNPEGATLYVTLEPCSTHGRTPPCTEAIRAAKIKRVVVGATDPNPRHAGRGFSSLRDAGIAVATGVLEPQCTAANEIFNHWIVHQSPFVTVKAAMSLDGKIATATGHSKWLTSIRARAHAQRLRLGHDAILVGINTILADDPLLTLRSPAKHPATPIQTPKCLHRFILDTRARTPLSSRILTKTPRHSTTVVVGANAAAKRIRALEQRAHVLIAPLHDKRLNLAWLLDRLGSQDITSLLVEGGGEVQAAFLLGGFAQRIAFFYAPLILGDQRAHKAVAGPGASHWNQVLQLHEPRYRQLSPDLFLTARVLPSKDRTARLASQSPSE